MNTAQVIKGTTIATLLSASLILPAHAADGDDAENSSVNRHHVSIGYMADDAGSRQYSGAPSVPGIG